MFGCNEDFADVAWRCSQRTRVAPRVHARRATNAVLCLLTLALTSCAVRVDREQTDYDQFGDRRDTYSTQASFIGQETADLEKAHALAREGKFADAIRLLEGVRARTDLDPETRQDVLLSLAQMHGAWRNAHKDYARGLTYLRELLAQYPDTAHRERATQMMETYEKALEE